MSTLFAGPWSGEFGYELFEWQGKLRAMSKDFDKVIAVNLKAGFFGTKFAIPEMRKSGGGCILFTSSGLGMRAFPQSMVYSLTKAALNMLTRGLAVQLGRDNIRVNAICPGPVDTTLVYKDMASSQEDPKKTNEDRPIARYGTVDEMAEAARIV